MVRAGYVEEGGSGEGMEGTAWVRAMIGVCQLESRQPLSVNTQKPDVLTNLTNGQE